MNLFRRLFGFDRSAPLASRRQQAERGPVCAWTFVRGYAYLAICPNCGRAGDKHERETDPSAPTVPGVNWLAGEKYKAKQ